MPLGLGGGTIRVVALLSRVIHASASTHVLKRYASYKVCARKGIVTSVSMAVNARVASLCVVFIIVFFKP